MIRGKKGEEEMLTENVIFIMLNLAFVAILVAFLILKSGGAAPMEEKYAKEIALMIDAARPGMEISFDMKDAVEKAQKEKRDFNEIVSFRENLVTVKLRNDGAYSYSFFNDVKPVFDLNEEGEATLTVRNKSNE